MNETVTKVKDSVDWKTVISVAVGLAAFGTAVYAVSKTSKTGKKIASVVSGG
jgi:myosin-crossreactive antigen